APCSPTCSRQGASRPWTNRDRSVCRTLKVLCAAADRSRLAELKRAAVGTHWELVGGASSVPELEQQMAEFEPDVVVVDAGLGERALRIYGPPVYVRKQIVHNIHVVHDLEAKGAVFVEDVRDVPEGAVLILSAHGVAPEVYEHSASRQLSVIDATCPLVTKVHLEARRFARDGYTILLIGHEGHEEVVGTSGEAPSQIKLVAAPGEARTVKGH